MTTLTFTPSKVQEYFVWIDRDEQFSADDFVPEKAERKVLARSMYEAAEMVAESEYSITANSVRLIVLEPNGDLNTVEVVRSWSVTHSAITTPEELAAE